MNNNSPTHRGLLHHTPITVKSVARSSPFYTAMFQYLGYELNGISHEGEYAHEDWKRWDWDMPHEISIIQADPKLAQIEHTRRSIGHHHHIAFCAADRADVDQFYAEVLAPLEKAGHCQVEDPPCDCPEYGDGYYATFFTDPDGLKFEFVINPNHLRKKKLREAS